MRVRILLIIILLTGCAKDQSKPIAETPKGDSPAVQATPVFDANRAFASLTRQTSFGPRTPGSPGHEACLQYMRRELEGTASNVTLQSFDELGYNGEQLHLTNVFASFNPKATTRVLLLAHWDTRPRADQDPDPKKRSQPILGANDAASGVAVLLEIARHLKESPPAIGVDILFVDGEDYGKEGDNAKYLLGTRYFASHQPSGYHPAFGILLDMVGDANLELMKEPNSLAYAKDIVDLVWSTAQSLGVYQFTDKVQHGVLDDHIPLNEAGIKTIDLIDFSYPDESNRYWHTTQDTPDKCSPASLEAVGKVLIEVLYHQPA